MTATTRAALLLGLLLPLGCATNDAPPRQEPSRLMADLIRVYGTTVVAGAFGADLQKHAPDAFRLFDLDGNGVIDTSELVAIDLTSPSLQVVLAVTLGNLTVQMIDKHRQ